MKRWWLLCLLITGWNTALHAQQTYQIRADSVRIYSACDTAELIIENHTQHTQGFLFNKGMGRTEFRKLRLKMTGPNTLSIVGQDTLDLSPWGDERYDLKSTNYWKIKDSTIAPFQQWPMFKVVGYDIYSGLDMPRLSRQAFQGVGNMRYYNGLMVGNGSTGFDMAVNWDGELWGPNGVFFRVKDDTKPHWSEWREVLFKDYAESNFIQNQKDSAQKMAHLWISGTAKIEDSVVLGKYKNTLAGDGVLSTDTAGNLRLKFITGGNNIYTTDGALTADRTLDAGGRSLLFRARNGMTDSSYMLIRSTGVKFGAVATGGVAQLEADRNTGARMSWSQAANALLFTLDSSRISFVKEVGATKDTLLYVSQYGATKINGELEVLGIYQSSQRKLKKDIQPFEKSALSILNSAAVQTFKYKADKNAITHIGFIAEDAPEEMAAPQRLGIDQANTVALLVKAMQELNQKVDGLQQEIGSLKKELADLKEKQK
ncbi:tail fiber domain-containing protein [Chitinophaga qingshengii]|uniref:Tail fiber domain-containing protein n=1 Tax=Chitinophaga qingshengii TaxID=1569794 RepID=A0ABR7TGI2_9BACT|nr:tail fiber domain-containing protein [Chitinophaga qingshengii]MBC9929524.1 tail fiber domain-containing protein [Chitinophaga qingshengii]